MANIWKFLWDIWGFIRHVLALRGLLQWTGYWENAVALIISILLTSFYWLSQNSWPVTILIFLSTFLVVKLVYRTIVDWNMIWPFIIIDTPYQDDFVEFKQPVYGRIYPSHKRLQVWILSGDGRYYNQRNVARNKNRWTVTCQFGNQTSPPGSPYEIVVISGAKEITSSPIDKLLDRVPKISLRVRRK